MFYRYDNQLLVEYRVRCAEGQLAYFNITALDMQGMDDCKDDEGHNKYECIICMHFCPSFLSRTYVYDLIIHDMLRKKGKAT